jgi:transposase
MTTKTVGIDLAKNVFQLHGVDELGGACLRKRIRREKLLEAVAD